MKKIVLIGAGGLGREVAFLIECKNKYIPTYELLGFLDDGDSFSTESRINGYPWLGKSDWILEHKDEVVCTCTIADTKVRAEIMERLMAQGVHFETISAVFCYQGTGAEIGEGCILFESTGVSVNCKLGKGVLLNEGVKIGHDTVIGDYCSFMFGVGISGNCQIGNMVQVGGHAFFVPGKKVGDNAKVAAGSVVFTNVKAGTTVLGNPAKRMRELE